MPTVHIESEKIDIAKKIIMPGDPKRAEYISNKFLTDAKKVNSVRGEDAYTGYYKGEMITVFSSGMGIPSMGIYSHELFKEYDADYIIRIGTAGTYVNDIHVNDVYLADSAYSESSFAKLSINQDINIVNSSKEVNEEIIKQAKQLGINIKSGRVHTTEAFYGYNKINEKAVKEYSANIVEMETFALLLNAQKLGKNASSILTVSDSLVTGEELNREERTKSVDTMIILALETLINL